MTIKQKILSEISKTKQYISDCKEDTETVNPDCAIDHSLRMEAFIESTQLMNTLDKAKVKLIKLKQVYLQVDKPGFGICKKCKLKIPFQRILIKPESLHCVACAD